MGSFGEVQVNLQPNQSVSGNCVTAGLHLPEASQGHYHQANAMAAADRNRQFLLAANHHGDMRKWSLEIL